jgi:hypothetical protein
MPLIFEHNRSMLKLRHGKNFGSYIGTCWRLLFTSALFPWMRKYRLSPDNIEVASFKFAAMRMWTGRMPKEINADNNTSVDIGNHGDEKDLKMTVESLQKELTRLQIENDMLRHAVYQPTNRKHLSTSMPIGEY